MNRPFDWLVVDGFSLLHREPECAALIRAGKAEVSRRLLLARLVREALPLARRVTVVFDGREAGGVSAADSEAGIDVWYSPAGLTADTVIERLVQKERNPASITVISSDRLVRETVFAAGSDSMGCTDFLALCDREAGKVRKQIRRRPGPTSTLGDFFPLS